MVGHRRRLPRRPHLHARGLRQTHFRGVLLGAGLPVERCDRHQASASRPRPRSPAQGIQAAHVPHRRYRSPRRRPAAAPRRAGHASSSGGPPREAAAGESQRLLSRAPYRPPCAGVQDAEEPRRSGDRLLGRSRQGAVHARPIAHAGQPGAAEELGPSAAHRLTRTDRTTKSVTEGGAFRPSYRRQGLSLPRTRPGYAEC